ncbi:MAG: tRNA pseudouridine(13) synthase TruD [Lachnospiraceae bacterium]|nr:tRNA pseudouridine(13) synthase TruD [Lachnospiraceae bacterium]
MARYKIKYFYSDFSVQEVCHLKYGKGSIKYYLLIKRGIRTVEAISKVALEMKIPEDHIRYAGLKDEDAVTMQYISIETDEIKNLRIEEGGTLVEIIYCGSGENHMKVGHLLGNSFKIRVRNVDNELARFIYSEKKSRISILNYYGPQRFGLPSMPKCTHMIGKNILDKDYEAALLLIEKSGNIKEEKRKWTGNEADYFKNMPENNLNFYISSWDSYLWNEQLKNIILEHCHVTEVCRQEGIDYLYGEFGSKLYNQLENVTMKHHKMVSNMEIEESEGKRYGYIDVNYIISGLEMDDYFQGSSMMDIEFYVPSGVYATTVIDQLMWKKEKDFFRENRRKG